MVAAAPTLTPFSGPYFFVDPMDGSLVYTHYESGRRYRITVLAGRSVVSATRLWAPADAGRSSSAAESGRWEIAIEEFETSRPRNVSRPELRRGRGRSAAASSLEFLDTVAPWRTDRTPAAALAAYVLWSATVGPAGFLRRPAVLMSKHWMDKVWSWDHCFNALALAAGPARTRAGPVPDPVRPPGRRGALPDSVTHSEVLYNFVKPPIHGWALQGLRRRLTTDLDRPTLLDIYTQTVCLVTVLARRPTRPGRPLPHYQHGNDSGWDNSTVFDAARVIETADLAAFLAQQLRILADLATELGLPADNHEWSALADRLQRAMFDELWDGERFAARGSADRRICPTQRAC